jgi:hypothetical protein
MFRVGRFWGLGFRAWKLGSGIQNLRLNYDNRCQGSDIRKNRKIVIFLSLKVCVPVHVYDFKS